MICLPSQRSLWRVSSRDAHNAEDRIEGTMRHFKGLSINYPGSVGFRTNLAMSGIDFIELGVCTNAIFYVIGLARLTDPVIF